MSLNNKLRELEIKASNVKVDNPNEISDLNIVLKTLNPFGEILPNMWIVPSSMIPPKGIIELDRHKRPVSK